MNKKEIKPIFLSENKIKYLEDFYNRKFEGKALNVVLRHLNDIKGVNAKTLNLKELRQLLNDWLLALYENEARRDTELTGFDEA